MTSFPNDIHERFDKIAADSPRFHEPVPLPALEAELKAEIIRLKTGPEGETEIERIYRDYKGPVSRRKALLDLSGPRLGQCVQRIVKRGATELTAICMPDQVVFEVSYAPRHDWLREGPVAQAAIVMPMLRVERPAPEFPPIGLPPIQVVGTQNSPEKATVKPARATRISRIKGGN